MAATTVLNTMPSTEPYHESFFYVDSFDELMGILPVPNDLVCQFCSMSTSVDIDFKRHMMQAHFRHSCNIEHEGKAGRILACRNECYPQSPQNSKRCHYHCPFCKSIYIRKEYLLLHLRKVKDGKCSQTRIRTVVGELILKRGMREESYNYNTDLVSICNTSEESENDKQIELPSYVVYPENEVADTTEFSEEDCSTSKKTRFSETHRPFHKRKSIQDSRTLAHRLPETTRPSVDTEDAVSLFGRTVVLRMKAFDARKQAEAMQKIMQVLFELEYPEPPQPKKNC